MGMVVVKEFRFEAAHRLLGDGGRWHSKAKCGSLHGHSWVGFAALELKPGAKPDEFGFVRDFGDFAPLKARIMEALDHATILNMQDPLVAILQGQGDRTFGTDGAPSSEYLAGMIYQWAVDLLEDGRTRVAWVEVRETCTSAARVTP